MNNSEASDDEPTTSTAPFKRRKIMDPNLDCASHSGSTFSSHFMYEGNENKNNVVWQLPEELLERSVNFQGFVMKIKQIWVENNTETYSTYDSVSRNLTKRFIEKIGEEIKLEEEKLYVERKFVEEEKFKDSETMPPLQSWTMPDTLSSEQLMKSVENDKVFLLSEQAGNGKSTELKVLAMNLKWKFPGRWVVFIDLEQLPQEVCQLLVDFESRKEISMFFTQTILRIEDFEAKIFDKLFKEGRVIFLVDGINKISKTVTKFVIELLGSVRKETKNQLWVATPKSLSAKLEQKLNTRSMEFLKLSKNDRQHFIQKIFETSTAAFLEKIENFLAKVENENHLVTNLRFLRLLANIQNDSLDFPLSGTVKIYEKLLEKIFEITNQEKSSDSFLKPHIKFYTKKAFEQIFPDEFGLEHCFLFKDAPDFSINQINQTGLISKYGPDDFRFMHQSLAEFFIAKFVFNTITKRKIHSRKEFKSVMKLWISLLTGSCKVIRLFLDEMFQNAQIGIRLSDSNYYDQQLENHLTNLEIFQNAVCENRFNLISFLSTELFSDQKNFFTNWLESGDENSKIILHIVKNMGISSLNKAWRFMVKVFTESQIKEILLNIGNEKSFLHEASLNIVNSQYALKFWLTKAQEHLTEIELEVLLSIKICHSKSFTSMETFLRSCKRLLNQQQYELVLKTKCARHKNLLHCAAEMFDSYTVELVFHEVDVTFGSEMIKSSIQVDPKCQQKSVFELAVTNKNRKVFETLWKSIPEEVLYESATNERMKKAFLLSVTSSSNETFEFVSKIYVQMAENLQSDFLNDNLLSLAAEHRNSGTFERLWMFFQKKLNDETLAKALIGMSKSTRTERMYKKQDNRFLIPFFVRFCKRKSPMFVNILDIVNKCKLSLVEEVANALDKHTLNPNIVNKGICRFILNRNLGRSRSNPSWYSSFGHWKEHMHQFIINRIENHELNDLLNIFGQEMVEEVLRDHYHWGSLFTSDFNDANLQIFLSIYELMRGRLNSSQLKKILMTRDDKYQNILYNSFRGNHELIEKVLEIYKNHFNVQELLEIFKEEQVSICKFILRIFSLNKDQKQFEDFWNFSQNYLGYESLLKTASKIFNAAVSSNRGRFKFFEHFVLHSLNFLQSKRLAAFWEKVFKHFEIDFFVTFAKSVQVGSELESILSKKIEIHCCLIEYDSFFCFLRLIYTCFHEGFNEERAYEQLKDDKQVQEYFFDFLTTKFFHNYNDLKGLVEIFGSRIMKLMFLEFRSGCFLEKLICIKHKHNYRGVLTTMKKLFAPEELLEVLRKTAEEGSSVLILAPVNMVEVFETLLSLVATEEDRKQLLTQTNNCGQSALHKSIQYCDDADLEFVIQIYEEHLAAEEMKELLTIDNDKNHFQIMNLKRCKESTEIILGLLEKYVGRQILLQNLVEKKQEIFTHSVAASFIIKKCKGEVSLDLILLLKHVVEKCQFRLTKQILTCIENGCQLANLMIDIEISIDEDFQDQRSFIYLLSFLHKSFKENVESQDESYFSLVNNEELKLSFKNLIDSNLMQNFTGLEVFKDFVGTFGPKVVKLMIFDGMEDSSIFLSIENKLCFSKFVLILNEMKENWNSQIVTKILSKKIKRDQSFLTIALRYFHSELIQTLMHFVEDKITRKKLLLLEDENGWNILRHSMAGKLSVTIKLLEESFDSHEMKMLLERNLAGCYNFFQFIEEAISFENKTITWDLMQRNFDDESLKKLLIGNKRVLCREIFDSFLIRTCSDNFLNDTLLMWLAAVEFSSTDCIKKMFTSVDKKTEFAWTFYQNLFQFQDDEKQNIFKRSLKSRSNVFEFVTSKAINLNMVSPKTLVELSGT